MKIMTKQFPKTFSLLCAGCLCSGFLTAEELQRDTGFKQHAPEAVSLTELAESTAQGGIQNVNYLVNSNLDATLTDNTAINTFSGDNIIDGNSFSGASGIVSIIQNTGNNVIIQDSTVVNVSIFP
ncbi:hypothetical protein [Kineobactrum sediminis]|uniref:hypothetical protein n=1 Tax=Kineobactrum sediminis TaxID=1905677 RepID=UPI0019D4AD2C|nr:hypothetical protein [Kineobactrum sediminis]